MTAVVTGLGVVAPTGLGAQDHWAATCEGRSGIGPVTRFDPSGYPARLAGEVPGFYAEEHLPSRLIPQTDRMTQLALAAAAWALADAGVETARLDPYDVGVVTASSAGGFEFGQRELQRLWSLGSRHVSAYQSFAWFYAVNTGQISIRHGIKGPGGVVVSDQAGGLDALAHARRQLRRGTRLVVSGSIDASICSWGWVARLASGGLATDDDPSRAYLPFDAHAHGYVPGEGGAIIILEDAEHAHSRGVPVYGEIAGYGSTFDPRPGDGEPALRRAIEVALADAGMQAREVDVVFADAAADPALDGAEAAAISGVFGPRAVPVSVPKSMTGRLHSGAAPLDVATALLAIRDGVIPPAINVVADPAYQLDLVTAVAREAAVRTALVAARGRGGFNSALVLKASV